LTAEQFIDDIRLAGLAMPVAYFMIERAAEMAMALKMENFNIPLSINVFGSEMLREDFIRFMDRVLLEHHLQSGDLHLEYASPTFASAKSHNQLRIEELRELGVHIGIDRFGESPIVLSALADLNVDYIKLAPSLTRQPQAEGVEHVVAELVAMQQQRGIKIICGGIENQPQLDFANKLKPDAVQGHLLEQPISSKGLMSWVHQWYFEQNN
jgi:EAL domain-containing protein (putative c-di-GMP-specific phosphodiesterase class I)